MISDMDYEEVDHPKHYNQIEGIECIDVIQHFNFCLGSALKYIWRAGLKPGVDWEVDLRKAIWYLEREIQRRKKDV
jgi:hypothetical protein